ncbi:MAG TPA: N-acetyl-D-Glu racemase DgcA [Xanthomonadales bacterium]|nr:N-acetyl-D-Glu racemase DgcA [Xanthomonadales bacterium]
MRKVSFSTESWEMKVPFRITGHTFSRAQLLHAIITEDGVSGQGEAAGVYYLGETGESVLAQAESVRRELEQGANREQLRELLPAGGARNAIDCALWDLEAKRKGKSIWDLTGIQPGNTISINTVGIGTPAEMAATARSLDTSKIKVKLDGELPLERISAVCAARPDAEIVVDVNQGWTFEQLVELAPKLKELGVAMIEQPLPRGGDKALEGYDSPIPLCADESCLDTSELEQASRRYQMINIKLDKTGGLTEALELAVLAQAKGIELMVGNMLGTSLAMAPGYVIAQLCRFADLDGALFLKQDRPNSMTYTRGVLSAPSTELWG